MMAVRDSGWGVSLRFRNRATGPGRRALQFSWKRPVRERSIWRTSCSPRVDAWPFIQASACWKRSGVMFNVSMSMMK